MNKTIDTIDREEVLRNAFNVELHAKVFTNYCEVIIWPDGKIEYAVPSHERKLMQCYAEHEGISIEDAMQELYNKTDAYEIMMKTTGICQIWYDHIYNEVPLTQQQCNALSDLIAHGCIDTRALDTIRYF